MRRLTLVLTVIVAFIAGFAFARRHVPLPLFIEPEATTFLLNTFVDDVSKNMSTPAQEQKGTTFSWINVADAADEPSIPILDNYNTKWRGHPGKHYEEWTTFAANHPHVFVTYDINNHNDPTEDKICISKSDPRTNEDPCEIYGNSQTQTQSQ